MTVHHDVPTPTSGHLHTTPTVDNTPPTRSKATAGLAVLACAACCALPVLTAAAVMWYLHRRRGARKAAAAGGGCASGNCGC